MKISYVLPVHNGQNTISQCIRSILKQTVKPHELIIINDASTDNTSRILDYYKSSKHEGIILVVITNEKRMGSARCRNIGNSLATGDVIKVCDVDIYNEKMGEAVEDFFEHNKDKSVFYTALECRSSKHPMDMWGMDAFEWDFNSKCPISHPTVSYRKCVSDEIKYHEDSTETDLYEFFLIDAHKAGYLFGGCQDPLMIKIEGDTIRNRKKAQKIKAKKYKKYGIII